MTGFFIRNISNDFFVCVFYFNKYLIGRYWVFHNDFRVIPNDDVCVKMNHIIEKKNCKDFVYLPYI